MNVRCFEFFGESYCTRVPNDQEAGIILILAICLIAGTAMRRRKN